MLPNIVFTSTIGCVFVFIVMPLGVAVCKRLYEKIKSEEHKEKGKVVQTLIKNYCLLYHFYRVYLSFHSLVVATTRYTFLMYDIQTESYGVKKLRNLFISVSIGVPLIHTIISICVQPLEVRWFSLF